MSLHYLYTMLLHYTPWCRRYKNFSEEARWEQAPALHLFAHRRTDFSIQVLMPPVDKLPFLCYNDPVRSQKIP